MDPIYMGIDQRLGIDPIVILNPRWPLSIHLLCLSPTNLAMMHIAICVC
jgi:hypothetical protein